MDKHLFSDMKEIATNNAHNLNRLFGKKFK